MIAGFIASSSWSDLHDNRTTNDFREMDTMSRAGLDTGQNPPPASLGLEVC
jgi:hypothetical protein